MVQNAASKRFPSKHPAGQRCAASPGGILLVRAGLQREPESSSEVPGGRLVWEEATQRAVRTEQVVLTTNAMPDVNGMMLGQGDRPHPSCT